MFNKNVLNNSYTIPKSYSNEKFSNIFVPIGRHEKKHKRRVKTPRALNQGFRRLNKQASIKFRKNFKKSQESILTNITPETWVNRLPALYLNMDNRKMKNYERIYFELIKLFEKKKENVENDDYYVKLYQNSEERNMNSSNNEIEAYYNINDYITVVKKPPYIRTMLDIYLILKFLSKTKLGQSFRDEFSDDEIYGKLITFCCLEIKYKKFNKGKKIFNIGDSPDYFYIILKGKVDIIKPLQIKTALTGNEYFLYLMSLLKNDDRYTYDLCIEHNDMNYVIAKDEEKFLPYIYIAIMLSKKKNDLFFKDILSSVNIAPKELGLTASKAMDDVFVRKNADKIKNFFPYRITTDLIDKYYFISDKYMPKDVYIYHEQKFLSLESKDHFGDSAMDGNTTRNATVIPSEDTEVGYIEMSLYHANISQEKLKLIHKKLRFFLENFFFKRINPLTFEKKYFAFFICNNYLKGDVLFNENENASFAYFIEDGIVELSTTKTIVEIQMLINILQSKRTNIENYFAYFKEEGEEMLLYNNIENNCKDLLRYINKKEKNKIIILKNNEDIGLISFFFDCPYFSKCVVTSNTAKIYKIDFKYLHQIMNNEKFCIYDLIKRINHKLKLFQERFFNINNIKLSIADKDETFKNKQKMELLRQEQMAKEVKTKTKNDKSKEKENKAEIEKFHEICLSFYNNKINQKSPKNKNRNNLNKTILPSIKTERIFSIKNGQKKHNILLSKILSRNSTKTGRKLMNNRNQVNLLFQHTGKQNKFINLNKIPEKLFSNNKDLEKDNANKNDFNYIESRLKLMQMEKIKSNIKVKKIEKDVFLKYYKKYARNTSELNLSLIFNKIQNKVKDTSMNSSDIYKQVSSRVSNKNAIMKEDLISRNQKLSYNSSMDNIIFASQKIKSKNLNETTNFVKNKEIKEFEDKKCSADLLNNETNKINNLQVKAYTDRKNINKNINHPYYSPSVLVKKKRYEMFLKNNRYNKKPEKIGIKFSKEFGFQNFVFDKIDISKKSI